MIDLIRKQKRVDYVEEAEEGARVELGLPVDLKEALDKALARLPEIQRNAVLLRDYEGYSYEEIGDPGINGIAGEGVHLPGEDNFEKYLVSIHHLI